MAVAAAGFALAAVTAASGQAAVMAVATIVFGCAYGLLLVAGLSRVEALAAPDDRASLTAIFYCLAYSGFTAPFAIALLRTAVPAAPLLGGAALLALATLALTSPTAHTR